MKVVAFSTDRSKNIVDSFTTVDNVEVVTTSDDCLFVRYSQLVRKGRLTIKSEYPDLLFVNRDGIAAFLLALLGMWYRKPLVIRLGGDPWRAHDEKFRENLRRKSFLNLALRLLIILMNKVSFNIATGFIVVSNDLRKKVIKEMQYPPDQVHVVHTSIDPAFFEQQCLSANSDLSITEDLVLLTVTNLKFRGKYEGVRDILPSINQILSEYHNVGYVIAGDGMYHQDLCQAIERNIDEEFYDRVYMPGYVNNVKYLYGISDIFVYMSYIDGYPNVMLEAKASSLPIIANPKFGMTEQITNGESGYLISPTDSDDFVNKLSFLIESAEERKRIGQTGRKEVAENDPEEIGQELIKALCEIYENS